jgi:hypothetical protein
VLALVVDLTLIEPDLYLATCHRCVDQAKDQGLVIGVKYFSGREPQVSLIRLVVLASERKTRP